MKRGLLNEVRKIKLTRKISTKRLSELGLEYKFMNLVLDNELTETEAVQKLKYASHQFAKRQLTWFRKYEDLHWLAPREAEISAQSLINALLAHS